MSLDSFAADLEVMQNSVAAKVVPGVQECWVSFEERQLTPTQARKMVEYLIVHERQRCFPNSYHFSAYAGDSLDRLVVLAVQDTSCEGDYFLLAFDAEDDSVTMVWKNMAFRGPMASNLRAEPLHGRDGALAFAFINTDSRGGRQLSVVSSRGEVRAFGLGVLDYRLVQNQSATALVAKVVTKHLGPSQCPETLDPHAFSCVEVEIEAVLFSADEKVSGDSVRTIARSSRTGPIPIAPAPEIDEAYRGVAATFAKEGKPREEGEPR